MSNDITDGVPCFSFFFYLHLIWCCVCVCVCRAAIFNMATILKLVCVKGLRGYARFAVLFLILWKCLCCSSKWPMCPSHLGAVTASAFPLCYSVWKLVFSGALITLLSLFWHCCGQRQQMITGEYMKDLHSPP